MSDAGASEDKKPDIKPEAGAADPNTITIRVRDQVRARDSCRGEKARAITLGFHFWRSAHALCTYAQTGEETFFKVKKSTRMEKVRAETCDPWALLL
jgi:hypothetical protein